MRIISKASGLIAAAVVAGSLSLVSGAVNAGATTTMASCSNISKSLVIADGFTAAVTPTITPYNYANLSANQANAMGSTIDFGPKALVVSCVSPADVAKLAKIAKLPATTTAAQYMSYVVMQAAGAMKKTMVGGVADYLDFGNGKEDGIGSLSKAGSIRLDAWVAPQGFLVFTFSQPASATPSAALLKFIASTNQVL